MPLSMKSIEVPEEFYSFVEAHNREDETMGDTLVRFTGGPYPTAVEELLTEETADAITGTVRDRASNVKKAG